MVCFGIRERHGAEAEHEGELGNAGLKYPHPKHDKGRNRREGRALSLRSVRIGSVARKAVQGSSELVIYEDASNRHGLVRVLFIGI